ncbi:hypothetical protein BE21_50565 [Sorangium cellulosum]|uniref:Uncharacterized protein n=1 Tax=Sorangium cellulosum TaxID=56 RepID=A0A150TG56_SORCE|nr:hypothetical protein BE21_50565 [Sorangium cellulosum]
MGGAGGMGEAGGGTGGTGGMAGSGGQGGMASASGTGGGQEPDGGCRVAPGPAENSGRGFAALVALGALFARRRRR